MSDENAVTDIYAIQEESEKLESSKKDRRTEAISSVPINEAAAERWDKIGQSDRVPIGG